MMYHVRVAHDDGARARDVTADMFTAEWFLCTPQGLRYHPFHTATIAVLLAHVATHGEDDPKAREVGHLADLMQQHGWHTVNDAFHEGICGTVTSVIWRAPACGLGAPLRLRARSPASARPLDG